MNLDCSSREIRSQGEKCESRLQLKRDNGVRVIIDARLQFKTAKE